MLPEVDGLKKPWVQIYYLKKKQKIIPQIKKNVKNKPRLGQGRAEIKHKSPNY